MVIGYWSLVSGEWLVICGLWLNFALCLLTTHYSLNSVSDVAAIVDAVEVNLGDRMIG